jgi:hypothetical protein
MSYLQSFTQITSRIERVVMMTLITVLLDATKDVIPMACVAIVYGSINIICMTLLRTVKTQTATRVLSCMRRITLFVFTHAVMRSSMNSGSIKIMDTESKIITFLKGFSLLCALTFIPKIVIDEDDGDSFSSQITYAYATNMEGLLYPLYTSRVFTLITFVCIVTTPHIHVQLRRCTGISYRILSNSLQAFDLMVFDAFTSQAFTDSGDVFCDLSIILGCFSILWNFHSIFPDMEGIQQFTTWRTAAVISKIMNDVNLNGITMSIFMFIFTIIHAAFRGNSSIVDGTPWIQDLLFLIALNGIISDTQKYIATMGNTDGIPILFGIVVAMTIVNDSAYEYTRNRGGRNGTLRNQVEFC